VHGHVCAHQWHLLTAPPKKLGAAGRRAERRKKESLLSFQKVFTLFRSRSQVYSKHAICLPGKPGPTPWPEARDDLRGGICAGAWPGARRNGRQRCLAASAISMKTVSEGEVCHQSPHLTSASDPSPVRSVMRPLPGLRVFADPSTSGRSPKHCGMAAAFTASSSLPEESLTVMRRALGFRV